KTRNPDPIDMPVAPFMIRRLGILFPSLIREIPQWVCNLQREPAGRTRAAMKVQQLLTHHGIKENPFGQEDAQNDQVFKRHCLAATYHPAWDKIFGSPEDPATAVVFGEKGSGKTALRLQIVCQIGRYNQEHPDQRILVVEYDDFNPFLDC